MTRITILPHEDLCPEGITFDARPSTLICDALVQHGVDIEHACEKSCVCTTCHIIVRVGFDSLRAASGTTKKIDSVKPGVWNRLHA